MLSASQLERCSSSYARGYRDGYWLQKQEAPKGVFSENSIRPFADFDYANGYEAGFNDQYWNKRHQLKW